MLRSAPYPDSVAVNRSYSSYSRRSAVERMAERSDAGIITCVDN